MDRDAKFSCQPSATGEVNVAAASRPKQPSLSEVLLMFTTVLAVHLTTVCRVRDFWEARLPYFDGPKYLEIAAIIRQGNLLGHARPYHFWGFPWAITGVSAVLAIPEPMALVLISLFSSLAVSIVVYRLYGGWVATTFIFINYQWIELSVEGGSEPLFMFLLFASFCAARCDGWNFAAVLASLSATVRPVGVLALLGFAVVLASRRRYRQLVMIAMIGLAVGVLYCVPVWMIMGNPFANYAGYRAEDWGATGLPITYPFRALIPSLLNAFRVGPRWPFMAMCVGWLVVLLLGTAMMWLPGNRWKLKIEPSEFLFLSAYTLFFMTYNYYGVSEHMNRFAIPAAPILLYVLRDWIPHKRPVLWVAAVFSALVASAGVVGFKDVFGFRCP